MEEGAPKSWNGSARMKTAQRSGNKELKSLQTETEGRKGRRVGGREGGRERAGGGGKRRRRRRERERESLKKNGQH